MAEEIGKGCKRHSLLIMSDFSSKLGHTDE